MTIQGYHRWGVWGPSGPNVWNNCPIKVEIPPSEILLWRSKNYIDLHNTCRNMANLMKYRTHTKSNRTHKKNAKPAGVNTIWRHGLNHICPIVPNPASTCMHPCYKTFSPVVIRVLSGQIRMLSLDLHLMIIFYNKLSAVIILNIKDIYFYYHK